MEIEVMETEETVGVIRGAVIGTLIGFRDDGRTPLVMYSGQRISRVISAMTVIDLHGAHIGRKAVLLFQNEETDPPIVVGLLRRAEAWPLAEQPGQVEVVADGERLTLTANEQLVLQCGNASITLTKAGKVIIRGTYVSNWSSGVMRIKGGSVQIN